MGIVEKHLLPALDGAERSTDVERYIDLFTRSANIEAPPYFLAPYGDSFRRQVNNPFWVIQSLISNAIKEGEGSRDLAVVADECEEVSLASDLLVHIGDEARHCRMYVHLIDTVFPDALPSELRDTLVGRFPSVSYEVKASVKQSTWKMLDYLIQINLGEVRTRIHQKLLEPVLDAYCPDEKRGSLCSILCKLAKDECCHVQYTASRIGALAREFRKQEVEELFQTRFLEFNRYTEVELGHQRDGAFSASLIRDR